ncbi:MAG TPA: alpha/beta hydrolase [Rhizomicrobium sp.]
MIREHRPGEVGTGSPSGRATQKNKPPVIMIHGGFCGPWAWDDFATHFREAGYNVATPCLRHHGGGKPPQTLATTSLSDYVADLKKLIDGMKTPPILVGHSLGGLLAQMLAARSNIAAAVLLAPSAPWGVPPSTLFEIGAAQGLMLRVGFWSMILEPVFDIAVTHSLDRFPKERRREIFEKFVPESGRVAFEILHWGLDMAKASEVDARKVNCPLLFLTGDNDRISPPGTVERIAALYKDRAQFEVIPDMSHWLIGEPGWESVCDRSLKWLASL